MRNKTSWPVDWTVVATVVVILSVLIIRDVHWNSKMKIWEASLTEAQIWEIGEMRGNILCLSVGDFIIFKDGRVGQVATPIRYEGGKNLYVDVRFGSSSAASDDYYFSFYKISEVERVVFYRNDISEWARIAHKFYNLGQNKKPKDEETVFIPPLPG